MKTGYSNLLGEYVDAVKLEYGDCAPLQIVCPACREAVFKSTTSSKPEAAHYLSHYRKDSAFDTDCELRVDKIDPRERQVHNGNSRDQRLLYFLRVFVSALERDPFINYGGRRLRHAHAQLTRSRAFRDFRRIHYESLVQSAVEEPNSFREFAGNYLDEFKAVATGVPKTGFSTEVQIRIAEDMLKHLLTEQGSSNYCSLFNHSAIYLLARLQAPRKDETFEESAVTHRLTNFTEDLICGEDDQVQQALMQMRHEPLYPPFVLQPSSYLVKICSEIAHEMVGTLLRLPYLELLHDYAG